MHRHNDLKHSHDNLNQKDKRNFPENFRQIHHHRHHHERFLQHYTYFRYLRPLGIAFTFVILYLAFYWGGNEEIGILFVTLLAVKEIIHFFFMWRLEKNIFKPMINLKQGLDEVTKGNYTIKVKNELSSDLGIVIDAFNEMTEKLYENEKLQMEYEENRKALIANISHDLKTPITAIQGYVEALMDSSITSKENQTKYLKTIHHNAIYVNKLIDDLFLFAKLDMQKLEFQYQCTKIRSFMDDLIAEYRFDFSERNIQFYYDVLLEEDVQVDLDGKRFHQAINNILNNAIQYGPTVGLSIEVIVYQQKDAVCIDIKDNGPGIPTEKLPFVFDRFYRIHRERPKETAGTGLGLAITKELIEAHGGRIILSSNLNQGSCFSIQLPICQKNDGEIDNETHFDY